MVITNRAWRVGRIAVAARYRSTHERDRTIAGKHDDNPLVIAAATAAQIMMNEMLPVLTIAEIAMDRDNVAILKMSASAIKKARNIE